MVDDLVVVGVEIVGEGVVGGGYDYESLDEV